MASVNMVLFAVLFIILSAFVIEARNGAVSPIGASKGLFTTKKVDLSFTSEVDGTVTAHCQSKDDDIGVQTLQRSQSFAFGFRVNFWGSTLFFCSFNWGSKHRSMDVYKNGFSGYCRHVGKKHVACDYAIRYDGFYLQDDSGNWTGLQTW